MNAVKALVAALALAALGGCAVVPAGPAYVTYSTGVYVPPPALYLPTGPSYYGRGYYSPPSHHHYHPRSYRRW